MKKIGKLVLLALLCLNSVVPVNAEEQPLTTIEPEVVETEDAAEISNEENIKLQYYNSVETITVEQTPDVLINSELDDLYEDKHSVDGIDDSSISNSNIDEIGEPTLINNSVQIVNNMKFEYTNGGSTIIISCDADDYGCSTSLGQITGQNIRLYDGNMSISSATVPSIIDNQISIDANLFNTHNQIDSNADLSKYLIKILVYGPNSLYIKLDKGVITAGNFKSAPNSGDVFISKTTFNGNLALQVWCNEGNQYDSCSAWLNGTDMSASIVGIDGGSTVWNENIFFNISSQNSKIGEINGSQEFISKFNELYDGLGTEYALLINVDEYYSFFSHEVYFENSGQNPSEGRYNYLPYGTKLEFNYLTGVKLTCPIDSNDKSECQNLFEAVNTITVSEPYEMPIDINLNDSFTIKENEESTILYIEIPSDYIEEEGNIILKKSSSIYINLEYDYYYQISPGTEHFYYPGAFDGCSISSPNNNLYTVTCGNQDTVDFFGKLSNNSSLFLEYKYGSIRLINYSLNAAENQITFDITKQNYNFLKGEYDDVWLSLYDSPMGGGSFSVNAKKRIASQDNIFIVEEDGKIPSPPKLNVSYKQDGEDAGLWITCNVTDDACSAFLDEIYSSTEKILTENIRAKTVFTLWPKGAPIYIPMKDDFDYPNPFEVKKDSNNNTIGLLVGIDWFYDHSELIDETATYEQIQLSAYNYLDTYQNIGGINIDLGLEECTHITGFKFDDEFNGIITTNLSNRYDAIELFQLIDGVDSTNAGELFNYSESNVMYDTDSLTYSYKVPVKELMLILTTANEKQLDNIEISLSFKANYKAIKILNVDVSGNPYHNTPSHQIIAVADGLIIESEDKKFLKSLVAGTDNNSVPNSSVVIRKVRQGPGESYAITLDTGDWIYDNITGTVKISLKWGDIERLHYKDDYGNNAKIDFKEEYYLVATAPYYYSFWYPEYTISLAPIKLPDNINKVNGSGKKDNTVLSILEESDDITALLEDLVVVDNVVNNNSVHGTDIVTDDVTVSGLLAAAISTNEQGDLDVSDYNVARDSALNVTISTIIDEIDDKNIENLENYANNNGMTQTDVGFDITVCKEYESTSTLQSDSSYIAITELPMDVALSFELPDGSKNYKLLHEHNGVIQELDVIKDGSEGIAFTNQFSSFMLVEVPLECSENVSACIGNIGFNTLEEAISSSNANAEIVLKKDIELTDSILINHNVILNMNTHRISVPNFINCALFEVQKDVIFTINGHGTFDLNESLLVESNQGHVILNNGNYNALSTIVKNIGGILTINDGRYINTNEQCNSYLFINSGIDSLFRSASAKLSSSIELNGGEFVNNFGIITSQGGNITITGGKYTSEKSSAIDSNYDLVTISNGVFKTNASNYAAVKFEGDSSSKVTISGGEFVSKDYTEAISINDVSLTIKGAKLSTPYDSLVTLKSVIDELKIVEIDKDGQKQLALGSSVDSAIANASKGTHVTVYANPNNDPFNGISSNVTVENLTNNPIVVNGHTVEGGGSYVIPMLLNDEGSQSSVSTWDDGGPFTTDACGSVYDRWGNKIYDAGSCGVDSTNGYQLVNTSDK